MRILIVEDDARLAEVIGRGLRKHAYATDLAADGEEGLFYAEMNDYDLMIFDVMLPKKDGFEMARHLRENKVATPILMLTARDAVADRITGLDSGADDYLVKPFDFEELLARVRALLRRRPNLAEQQIGVGNLILNRDARTAKRSNRKIDLTTKEYALLEFLMDNVERVVTRERIAETVWDINFDAFSNVIDVYIKRLRRKVDTTGEKPLIHTRRGTGYVLSANLSDE